MAAILCHLAAGGFLRFSTDLSEALIAVQVSYLYFSNHFWDAQTRSLITDDSIAVESLGNTLSSTLVDSLRKHFSMLAVGNCFFFWLDCKVHFLRRLLSWTTVIDLAGCMFYGWHDFVRPNLNRSTGRRRLAPRLGPGVSQARATVGATLAPAWPNCFLLALSLAHPGANQSRYDVTPGTPWDDLG